MALKVIEGWDHYSNPATDMLQRQGLLQWTAQPSASLVTGRNGYGRALQCGSSTYGSLNGVLGANFATLYAGFALVLSTNNNVTFSFGDAVAGSAQVVFTLNAATGVISAGSGGSPLATSGTNAFSPYVYNYFEFGATINATTGMVACRVNGVSVLSATGIDTQYTANAYTNEIIFADTVSGIGPNFTIDDLYVCDSTTGPGTYPCNGFLGDVSVDTVYPSANNAVAWTPLASANWQEVSEVAMDSDSSYNYSATAGQVDTFAIGALRAATNLVYGVQVTGAYRKDDASSRTIQQRVLSASTVGAGTAASIPTGYVYISDMFAVDPNTSASWAVASVNALKVGYELVS
jgi:hypothetical protein